MTVRLTEGDILVLDRIKEAGGYPSRNAVLHALILKCGTQYASRLETAFSEVSFDTSSVTNDVYLTPSNTSLETPHDTTSVTNDVYLTPNSTDVTPTHDTTLTPHDTTLVTNDVTSTPLDWNTLISEA